jgi:DNA-binding transcriptional ArsR family regulator
MQELPYRASRIHRALGNPLRYRILARLARGPATPGELARELNRPLYVISHHLGRLRALDLVWYHPDGPSYQYAVKYGSICNLLAATTACAGEIRRDDPPGTMLID